MAKKLLRDMITTYRKPKKKTYNDSDRFEERIQSHAYIKNLYAKIISLDTPIKAPELGDEIVFIVGTKDTYLGRGTVTNWTDKLPKHPFDKYGYIQVARYKDDGSIEMQSTTPLHRIVRDTPRVRELIALVSSHQPINKRGAK